VIVVSASSESENISLINRSKLVSGWARLNLLRVLSSVDVGILLGGIPSSSLDRLISTGNGSCGVLLSLSASVFPVN
jgi:hypothetical protein